MVLKEARSQDNVKSQHQFTGARFHIAGLSRQSGQPFTLQAKTKRPVGFQPRIYMTVLPRAHGAVAPGH
jgi:hypothetical protein